MDSCSEQPSMMSQSDFLKNAGRWGGSDVAARHYRAAVLSNASYAGHRSRLDRDFGRKRFGDQGYAMEELVAELGSAFLSADLDLTPELRSDHASYIASWIKVLKDDKRAIFTAASHAQRAADFLHGLQKSVSDQADSA
jgi:antirestriction protein ArdC